MRVSVRVRGVWEYLEPIAEEVLIMPERDGHPPQRSRENYTARPQVALT